MDWSLWDVLWTTFVVFIWISLLIIFFNVIFDIFRSSDLSGWAKAGWLLFVIVLPLIGMLVYVLARGDGMTGRAAREQIDRADRIRESMGETAGDPTAQIARAKQLLDSGAIDQAEYEQLKGKALA